MSRFWYIHILLFVFAIGISLSGEAQISPGPLSDAHAEFEGISNCTLCHDLGKQVSSAKCLECHEDIQSLIDEERGFHSSSEVVSKECFECHGEHHGKKFDSKRFDQDSFDHDLTTYILEGQHDVIDCRECHSPEYIEDIEIAKRDDTFLGLSHECIACHEDYHQGTLTNNEDCASCHNIESFRPAPFFDHDETNYPLEGQHVEVDCKECHPITTRNSTEFQEFTGLPFNDCVACHEDPHESQLPGDCKQCHSVEGFEVFLGQTEPRFDHNQTKFEIRGSHTEVACFECHTPDLEARIILQDQNGIGQNDCVSCHEDVHEGKFGQDCAQCHNETSWLSIESLDNFDHDLTDYPLEGKHVEVDCKECHTGNYTEALAHDRCMDCHDDFHEGVFVADNPSSDCIECHALTAGFEETTFTIERHEETVFPLEGGHLATPCFACHVDESEEWVFRDLGSDCAHCHEDIHMGQFEESGSTDCTSCHNSETWFPTLFDHDETEFALEGRHAEIECAACHQPEVRDGSDFVDYQIEKFECVDCHTL
ncbi:MAG: cytochrome c family protein [Cyclobacteriaceae bacterium]